MQDKMYRPGTSGKKGDVQDDGTIVNKPINKPVPVGNKPLPVRPPVMNKPVPIGGKPTRPVNKPVPIGGKPLRPGFATLPVIRPAKPGTRPMKPGRPGGSEADAKREALKRAQEMAALRKGSGN
jgi:hypothetical protein